VQSAVEQTALSLKNTNFNFISRGGKWLFGTEQTIQFNLKALHNDQETVKKLNPNIFLNSFNAFLNDMMK